MAAWVILFSYKSNHDRLTHIRTSNHCLPMTLRIKSKILIMPTRLCMTLLLYLLAYFPTLIWYHSPLPTTLKPSWTSHIYSHLRASAFTVFSAWNAHLPHLHMTCSFSLFKVSIQMSCHPVREAFPDHSLCIHSHFPSHYHMYHCL